MTETLLPTTSQDKAFRRMIYLPQKQFVCAKLFHVSPIHSEMGNLTV